MSEGCKKLRLNLKLQAILQRGYFHILFPLFNLYWHIGRSLNSEELLVIFRGGFRPSDKEREGGLLPLIRHWYLRISLLLAPDVLITIDCLFASIKPWYLSSTSWNTVNGHGLCFKGRLTAKLLIWKWSFYSHTNKTHFHREGFALSTF